MSSIQFINLTKSYPYSSGKRLRAVNDLSLEIDVGNVFGFLGPNGAGKSTTINTTMGFIKPDSGTVYINGIPSVEPEARKNIGYLPEHPNLYDQLTALELMKFSGEAARLPKDVIMDSTEMLLKKLELLSFKHRPVRTFSKGMKQRIGLAMAMIKDPPILILDEPMSGLDPMGRRLVADIILELKERGKTVFFSTHILNDVEVLCDNIAVIDSGCMLYNGCTKEFVSNNHNLEDAFLSLIRNNRSKK